MVEKHKHVTITNWKGHKNYECNHCNFATLSRREFSLHLDMHMRAGIIEAEKVEAESNDEPVDENYGLDVAKPEKGDTQTKGKKKKDGK